MAKYRRIFIFALVIFLLGGITACGGDPADTTATPTTTTTAAETTEPEPTGPQLAENYPDEIIIAADNSPQEWIDKAKYVCVQGELPKELISALRQGGVYKFAPGEYLIEGQARSFYVGSNTTVTGAYKIIQPKAQDEMLYPDPSYMAVFVTRSELPSIQSSTDEQYGKISLTTSKNAVVSNIALSGHTVLKIENSQNATIDSVLIHNYRGTYPDGQWCNMGYGRATGSLWLYGQCRNIEIKNCQIQCSSHHGLTIQSPGGQYLAKDINITGTRALYCGCGQLRGETQERFAEAAARLPETGGYGYYDWSCAFDVCENQDVENIKLEDCYALDGWKAGFYTEPLSSGAKATNISFIRCRSDHAGRRAVLKGSNPKATIPQATEGANFFVQGGYFEDCISVSGEKVGWYMNPNRVGANGSGDGIIKMVNCGDMGSPISLVTEMTDSRGLHTEGFFSLNAQKYAMWLFGEGDFILEDTVILSSNHANPSIKIGYMIRFQLVESRDPWLQSLVAPGGKYDVLRTHLKNSRITGTIYGLPEAFAAVEIVSGATFNGTADPNAQSSMITLARDNTTQIDIKDYIN